MKYAPLLGRGQAGIQGQYLGVRHAVTGQVISRFPDLALSGQKYQNVAPGVLAAEPADRVRYAAVKVTA
jgi:hypothetical protein